MNTGLSDLDPSIEYYDSDYPSTDHGPYPENLDPVTELQGVARDVDRYLELLADLEGPILEVGCGTGRVAIPLARAGHRVTSVDISAGMLARFRDKLERENAKLVARLTLVNADATALDLPEKEFAGAIVPFNTLPCITSAAAQLAALACIAAHQRPGGLLLVDLINPLRVVMAGDAVPKPFFTRRNVWTGNVYTRFAAVGPMETDQTQELKGWYDEIEEGDRLRRRPYYFRWRPLFLNELRLMLDRAGFEIVAVEGDHAGAPFKKDSPKMFVRAVRVART